MKYVAVIGSRTPTKEQTKSCIHFVEGLVSKGYGIITGCADGIDSIAMGVVNSIDPSLLFVVLPWASYNNHYIHKDNKTLTYDNKIHSLWAESVSKYHPYAHRLTQGAYALHARNYGIVINSVAVVAYPHRKTGGGGTGQGMRIARHLNKILKINPGVKL